jgi:predicted DNA-binding protein (MmcQ/YjbR family)
MLYLCYLHSIVKNHTNKKHWNTVLLDGSVPDKDVFAWIDHSYNLVAGKK